MEREALNMIYKITKFRHYLLSRKFTFHVNHSTLFYLVNKQALAGVTGLGNTVPTFYS